jgi:hypothetical protein
MNEALTNFVIDNEEAFYDELPDVALEVAAGKYGEAGNPLTLAFCSGFETCPA